MSPLLERIIEQLQALSQEERQQLQKLLEGELSPKAAQTGPALVEKVRGKYAHVPTSSAAFARRKVEESEIENRRTRS